MTKLQQTLQLPEAQQGHNKPNNNPQPLSPMLSPLISPSWPFTAPNYSPSPFVGIVHQPQFLFNNMHQNMGNTG